MHRLLPLLTGLVLASTPVVAEGISASADHVLWCASAFAQLANDAAEQNDAGDTELYDSLAAALTSQGIDLLRADSVPDERIAAIIQAYDDMVYVQLETPEARYPVESCESLMRQG